MNLGFYYHIPIVKKEGGLYIPGFLGIFIDSLATEVDQLTLIMHEGAAENYPGADYKLKEKNIKFANLGSPKPAWHRSFFPGKTFKDTPSKIDCDCIIVRSPTPLATSFTKYFPKQQVFFMVVGDYVEGADHLKSSTFRDRVIFRYLQIFDKQFNKVIRKSKILVNSPALLKKYKSIALKASLINTTTISDNDINKVEKEIDKSKEINLLFTGRIDPAKGLFELVEATAALNKKYKRVVLNIVGWEDQQEKPVESKLNQTAEKLGIKENVIFHGRKKVGPELFSYYQNADVYVLPSYHEGFPRTIWEAMAKGLPVVATTVGGIPEFLESEKNCLLIPPRDVEAIVDNVELLIENPERRKSIVAGAYERVAEVTLEKQTNKIIGIAKSYMNE